MRILEINTVCGTGSTGRIVTDLYSVLEEHGHECVIAYGRGKAKENIKSIKIGASIDNYIHGIKTRVFDNHGFSSTKATKKFIEKVKLYNPNVIHLHNIHGYYINIEILFNYLRDSKKPVIWTLHDCWAFTGHCAYFDYVTCEKWKKQCENCVQRSTYPSSKLVDNSKWNYLKKKELFTSLDNMTIVTPSKWLRDIVKKSFLSKYDIKVINNGIDLDIFKPTKGKFRESNNLENKFIILGVANVWEKRKGLDTFIELSKNINENSRIVLVGLDKNKIKDLPKNIIGITRTANVRELTEIYTEADVLVNPTLEDNFPTVNLEALACGTPVITYNTGGSPESIDEECGIIVEKNDLKELIEIINNIDMKKLKEHACINRSKLYDKKARYNDYLRILNNLNKSMINFKRDLMEIANEEIF